MYFSQYEPAFFEDLPDIVGSYKRLVFRNGLQLLSAARQLLIEQNAEQNFGVRLLHKHFHLTEDERLVQHGDVAVPWTQGLIKAVGRTGVVRPTAWLFRDEGVYPYEFRYIANDGEDELADFHVDFHEKTFALFFEFLREHQLSDVLGLFLLDKASLDQGPVLEFNLEGDRTSIVFPQSEGTEYLKDPFEEKEGCENVTIPASWCFAEGGKMHGGCGVALHHCSSHNPPPRVGEDFSELLWQ